MAERIDVNQPDAVRWLRGWQAGDVIVRLGETGDQRWVAWHSGRGQAYAYWDERAACRQLDRWLARGDWTELQAAG